MWETLISWRSEARVRWCQVFENRPEIITRRDKGTAVDWFHGKRVALWGCGAIGGLIAEHLARAGAGELTLYDQARVTPGVLVRQNFSAIDTNDAKVEALARRLHAVAPGLKVTTRAENIISQTLNRSDWDADIDIVIDATASLRVRSKLEVVLKDHQPRVPVAAIMISPTAQYAVAVLAPPGHKAGPLDVLRRLRPHGPQSTLAEQLGTCLLDKQRQHSSPPARTGMLRSNVRRLACRCGQLFRPSTECVGRPTNRARRHRQRLPLLPVARSRPTRYPVSSRHSLGGRRDRLPHVGQRVAGHDRLDSRRGHANGPRNTKPGDCFSATSTRPSGSRGITNVSGPPRDSTFSAKLFVCGTEGTSDLCQDYKDRTHRIARYVGTWHSHPVSPAEPSPTDYVGIGTIFATAEVDSAHQLMVIVGHAAGVWPQIGAYAFEKRDLVAHRTGIEMAINVRGGLTTPPPVDALDKTIGLSLSGGGSRAVAFHLGTLRALEDLKLLDEVDIVSGVSGGSVMTSLFGYTEAPFADIDGNAVKFLRRGLVWPALKKLPHPARALPLLWNFLVVTLPTLATDLIAWIASFARSLLPAPGPAVDAVSRVSWPLRRRYSRTHVIADAIADAVGTQNCDAPTRQGKSIVFNACELRTGTAFRMSNERFGSWRYGWAPASELPVADAVAASAAYPPFLPPFEWMRSFEQQGKISTDRVIVTDGGVFENLGVSVMEPGRDSLLSAIAYNPDIIIASDAGAGQFTGETMPRSWPKRMTKVVSAVMRKVQDATKARLHDHAESGRIDGFIYAALGQIDRRVPLKPANWVDREEVIHYPTDFSAMSVENIRRLSARGQAITRALVTQYLLSD